jgi:hypothetical protein
LEIKLTDRRKIYTFYVICNYFSQQSRLDQPRY